MNNAFFGWHMTKIFFLAKVFLIGVLLHTALVQNSHAQEKPVMENVFFNVVWGSAFGAIMGVAVAVIGSEDKSSPEDVRTAAFSGATAGGLLGLGLGLWVVFQGATFETPGGIGDASSPSSVPFMLAEPPLVLLSSREKPWKITGFKATVFHMKF